MAAGTQGDRERTEMKEGFWTSDSIGRKLADGATWLLTCYPLRKRKTVFKDRVLVQQRLSGSHHRPRDQSIWP